jgi:hypothetical protein
MRSWSKRERALGVALALSVVAAIVVPAQADDSTDGGAAAPASSIGAEGDAAQVPLIAAKGAPARAPLPAKIDPPPMVDGLANCLRRHGAQLPAIRPEGDELPVPRPKGDKLPAIRPEDELPVPRPADDEAFGRAAEACGLPEPPPGTDPFPLSDAQIEAESAKLDEFVRCMRAHGARLGDPVVEGDRIAIEPGSDAFSEEFLAAQRDCGGLPLPPAP